jgi:hypothetical protein
VLYRLKQLPHNPVLFLFGGVYLWLVVEPRLIYQCFGNILSDAPIFLTGWSFLRGSLAMPGGFVMYVAGFLSQGYYYSWLGTVVVVLSALFLCELSRRHLLVAGYMHPAVLVSIPAILLFLICSRYKHSLPPCLAVSLGLLCSLVFERLPWRRPAIRMAVYCLIAALLFWLAGAAGLFIFSLMTLIHGALVRRELVVPVLALPVGFAIIWGLAQYVFLIPPRQAFLILTPFAPVVTTGMKTFSRVLTIILYGFVPASVLVLFPARAVFGMIAQSREPRSKRARRKRARAVTGQKKVSSAVFNKGLVFAAPIILMAVGFCFTYERMSKTFLVAHDYSLRKRWGKILDLARSLPAGTSNIYFNHDIIRALYHTGRLPHDMFAFPQTPHGLFLTHDEKVSYLTQWKLCDTFMELGQVNLAEKLASEILATKKHCGPVVEKLAWINIVKKRNRTARVYLNALKKDLVYHRTAASLLSALDNGLSPEQAAYVDRIRWRMLRAEDSGTGKDSIEQMLGGLLIRNTHNRMAFEYLMACYLLSGRVDMIAANAERLGDFGYRAIPIPYEEAVLIYIGSRKQKVDLKGLSIRHQTIERYKRFVQLRSTMQPHNRNVVLNRLIREFGSSYFFYFTFGCVGAV